MSQKDWDSVSAAALKLFEFGQQQAAQRGLLLVDTKYEFGKDANGGICLIDEVRCCAISSAWQGSAGGCILGRRAPPRLLSPLLPACPAQSSPAACRPQIHTPDSSRYWLADTYEARHAAGQEPQNIDKEFLRLWFRARCDPYKDEVGLPAAGAAGVGLALGCARFWAAAYGGLRALVRCAAPARPHTTLPTHAQCAGAARGARRACVRAQPPLRVPV
jgi:phosphoribosylaminoimidazole-succinocarboxamide synthase